MDYPQSNMESPTISLNLLLVYHVHPEHAYSPEIRISIHDTISTRKSISGTTSYLGYLYANPVRDVDIHMGYPHEMSYPSGTSI